MNSENGAVGTARLGLAVIQMIVRLVGAGSVLFSAHRLFLRYFHNEMIGLLFSGVNRCAGEEQVANGDLITDAITLCHEPLNYAPWLVLYRHHWQAASAYYGAILLAIILAGYVVTRLQRRAIPSSPFGRPVRGPSPVDSEHLR